MSNRLFTVVLVSLLLVNEATGLAQAGESDYSSEDQNIGERLKNSSPSSSQSDVDLWSTYTNAGDKELRNEQYTDAQKFYSLALITAEGSGKEDSRLATSIDNIASVYWARGGRLPEVEKLQKRALALREKELGNDHPEITARLIRLAQVLVRQKKLNEAEEILHIAIPSSNKALKLDRNDSQGIVPSLNNLGVIYLHERMYHKAELIYNEVVLLNPNYYLGFANRSVAKRYQKNEEGAHADLAEARRLGYKR